MTTAPNPAVEARVDQLHAHGIVDMHFDMLMDLYDKRARTGVLEADYLPDLERGGVGILGAAIYVEDKYLPEQALRVALAQVARLYTEVDQTARFAICRSHAAIVAARGGVVGANAVLVSPHAEDSTLDRYVDEIAYLVELAGIDGVGIGFDFFEFIYRRWSAAERAELDRRLSKAHFLPDLAHHGHARNLTRKLIARGFGDAQIAQILYGNWMRVFAQVLTS